MTYWQHTPTGSDERLVELAQLFADCRAAFFESADRFHWAPSPGSISESAALALPSPDPAITTPTGETGHRLIAEVVQTYLLTATGHLGGLAALYASTEVFFPPALLVRAVIENSAHAMWVIGDNPNEDPERRLARAYLEDFLSAEEAKKNAGRLGDKTSQSYLDAQAGYTKVRADILARFPGATRESLSTRTLLDEQLLNPEACVAWMYSLAERAGGSNINDRQALGIYGFLSNMTHPTLYPARQLRRWHIPDDGGHAVAYLSLDIPFLERQASAAVVAFYNALAYITSYFGWSTEIHDQLTERIDEVLPTVFT